MHWDNGWGRDVQYKSNIWKGLSNAEVSSGKSWRQLSLSWMRGHQPAAGSPYYPPDGLGGPLITRPRSRPCIITVCIRTFGPKTRTHCSAQRCALSACPSGSWCGVCILTSPWIITVCTTCLADRQTDTGWQTQCFFMQCATNATATTIPTTSWFEQRYIWI